jgi:hypothetical protein
LTIAHSTVYLLGNFTTSPYANALEAYYDGNTGSPNVTVSGSNTGYPARGTSCGIAVDKAGTVYAGFIGGSVIDEYAPSALQPGGALNIPPSATLNDGSDGVAGLALDSSSTLYVNANLVDYVNEYTAGSTGSAAPVVTIANNYLGDGLALDANGAVYTTSGSSVVEYAAGASGNVAPNVTIAGAATGLNDPEGVAVDAFGDVFAANFNNDTVTEYPPHASGNAAPSATITLGLIGGSVYRPSAVAVDAQGTLYVGDDNHGAFLEYVAGATGAATPIAIAKAGLSVCSLAAVPSAVQP